MAIELDFLNELDRFQLALKKNVHSQYQGARETRKFGEGLVFKDFREYVPGDDIRFIDWKVYARTNKYYIKRFEEERNLTVHIVVDSSSSMNFGTGDHTKFEYASMIGLGFSYMAMSNNEKFNFNTFADELEMVRPEKGRDQLMSIYDHLQKHEPEGESKFKDSLETYKKAITSKSMVVLISDFLYPVEEFREIMERYRKSELVVIQVLDPSEVDVNLQGDVILKDSEQDSQMRTFLSRRMVKQYKDKLHEHIAKLRNICEETQATFIPTTTDKPVFDVFYEVLSN